MRRLAWALLLLFGFTIPWEYSLDLGEPFGNVARIVGLLALLAAVPAVLETGRLRTPGGIQGPGVGPLLLVLLLLFLDDRATGDPKQDARLLSGNDGRLAGVGVRRKSARLARFDARLCGRLMGSGRPDTGELCFTGGDCRGTDSVCSRGAGS